jgi:hypothetical protein
MTFTVSKRVHNLPQTSIPLGKLIASNKKKKSTASKNSEIREMGTKPLKNKCVNRRIFYMLTTLLPFSVSLERACQEFALDSLMMERVGAVYRLLILHADTSASLPYSSRESLGGVRAG